MNISDINLDKYEILRNGKIWSVSKQKFLKGKKDRDGYTLFELSSKDGKFHTYKLHRIIAELYCDVPDGYSVNELEVDHIIPISEGGGNEYTNLRWCTPKENHNNPITLINRSKSMRNKQSMSKSVKQIKNDEVIAEFPSTREVERQLGYDHKAISKCCRGLKNTAYGFKWEYKE